MTQAEVIKKARRKANLTQKQLAEKYSIPVSTLICWENGQRKAPEYVVNLLLRCMVIDFPLEQEQEHTDVLSEQPSDEQSKKISQQETVKEPLLEFYYIHGSLMSAVDKEAVCRAIDDGIAVCYNNYTCNDGSIRYNFKFTTKDYTFYIISRK